jgi:hypothetical protein
MFQPSFIVGDSSQMINDQPPQSPICERSVPNDSANNLVVSEKTNPARKTETAIEHFYRLSSNREAAQVLQTGQLLLLSFQTTAGLLCIQLKYEYSALMLGFYN